MISARQPANNTDFSRLPSSSRQADTGPEFTPSQSAARSAHTGAVAKASQCDDAVLEKLDQARSYLVQAHDLMSVKDVRDKAIAIKIYAKEQKASEELVQKAEEIRVRAERRLGELLKEMPKNQGAKPGKTGSKGVPV